MPPALAATNDRTRTPNRSSRRLTPGIAPLSAKTKVPTGRAPAGAFIAGSFERGLAATAHVLRSTSKRLCVGRSLPARPRAATTSASTPVCRVGWMTGAKRGLWLVGISLSRPAAFAFA